jgi:hypothetical protein
MNLGKVSYCSVAPPDYKCSACGAHGCKLWRQYNRIASAIELLCGSCALKDQRKSGPIDADGYVHDDEIGQRCDQIGWLVPAVPTEDGDTFWGYSSVPPAGVKWWRALPTEVPR